MDDKKEFLTEEKYEKGKKKIKTIALTIIIAGLLIGGSLIAFGLTRSTSSKIDNVKQQLEEEKQSLIAKKTELESKIKPVQDEITSLMREKFTGFDDAYYAREDKISELAKNIESDNKAIDTINDVIEDGYDTCNTFENNYSYTANYCSLTSKLSSLSDSSWSIPFYMFGTFAIISSFMFAIPLYITSKGREINAFMAQQQMPVVQEGIDKMAPTVGKAAGTIAKGIKEGLKDEDK